MVLAINSIFPVTGRLNQSTNITILGEDFGAGSTVKVGSVQATNVLVVNTERITCTIPGNLEEGIYSIIVSLGSEMVVLDNAFNIVVSFPAYPYIDQTFDVIQSRMLSRLPANYEKFEGSTLYDLYAPVSLELADAYLALAVVHDLLFLPTSTGSYLDFIGIGIGILRIKGTKAIGAVTFAGTSAVRIPKDFQVSNVPATASSEQILFITDEEITLTGTGTTYTGTVNITAVEVGRSGNFAASLINNIVSPLGGLTSVVNANAITGGSDRESHFEYRSRMLAQVLTPGRAGNVADYKQWARQASPYVGKVGVDALRRDENSGVAQHGTVGVYPLNVDGSALSAILLQTVRDYIGPDNEGKGRAPIGASPYIASPTFVDIHVRVNITAQTGFVESVLLIEVQEAIATYINDLDIGENILYHTLGSVINSVNGVASISAYFVSMSNDTPLNTENDDIAINNTQKSRGGTITVT